MRAVNLDPMVDAEVTALLQVLAGATPSARPRAAQTLPELRRARSGVTLPEKQESDREPEPDESIRVRRKLVSLFGQSHGKEKLQTRWAQEIGQTRRLDARVFDENDPEATAGSNIDATVNKMVELARCDQSEVIILPSQGDARLRGLPTYVAGNPLDPMLCAALMGAWTSRGDLVVEFGPAIIPASSLPARVLGRRCATPRMPTPNAPDILMRTVHPRKKHEEKLDPSSVPLPAPALVIVPLPLPLDAWSIRQAVTLPARSSGGIWALVGDEHPADVHPELSTEATQFLGAIENRLGLLNRWLQQSTRVAVVSPGRLGLPRAVETLINRSALRWRCIQRHWAIHQGGTLDLPESETRFPKLPSAAAGLPLDIVQMVTGHRSLQSLNGYIRRGSALKSAGMLVDAIGL